MNVVLENLYQKKLFRKFLKQLYWIEKIVHSSAALRLQVIFLQKYIN